MKKYSRRAREGAALICAIAASTPRFEHCFADVANALGLDRSHPALDLACLAWWHQNNRGWMTPGVERSARAESLIRTWWSP